MRQCIQDLQCSVEKSGVQDATETWYGSYQVFTAVSRLKSMIHYSDKGGNFERPFSHYILHYMGLGQVL